MMNPQPAGEDDLKKRLQDQASEIEAPGDEVLVGPAVLARLLQLIVRVRPVLAPVVP